MNDSAWQPFVEAALSLMPVASDVSNISHLRQVLKRNSLFGLLCEHEENNQLTPLLSSELSFLLKYRADTWGLPFVLNDEDVARAASALKQARSWILEACGTSDARLFCLGIWVLAFFYLRLTDILEPEHIRRLRESSIPVSIKRLLSAFGINLRVVGAPYHEQRMYSQYVEGLKEGQLLKVMAFVSAVERGGAIRPNYRFEALSETLFVLNPCDYWKILSDKHDPIEISVFISPLLTAQKLDLPESHKYNRWLFFEILRHSISDPIPSREFIGRLRLHLETILKEDPDFFFQTVDLLLVNLEFARSVGQTFGHVHKVVLDQFIARLPLDKYSYKRAAINQILEGLNDAGDPDNTGHFMEAAYHRWQSFMEGLDGDEGAYLNALVETDYIDVVINYLGQKFEKVDDLIAVIVELVPRIRFTDETWRRSFASQARSFFVLLSRILVLSYVFRHRSWTLPANRAEADSIKNTFMDKRIWLLYFGQSSVPEAFTRILGNCGI